MQLSSARHSRSSNDTAQLPWRDDTGFSELYDYWEAIREPNAPLPADKFDLLALTPWLADICLLDVIGPDNYFCRFAGTAFVERLGFDMSGKIFLHSSRTRPAT